MDLTQLDTYLHRVEDYEKKVHALYQGFLESHGYDAADAQEQFRIRKKWEEQETEWYRSHWYKDPIVLSYTTGSANQLVNPYSGGRQGQVLHSRSLSADDHGIRKWMMIQKHPRFGVTFEHEHSFVEVNYCYSGTITNYVNGHPYVMRKGDLLIMEPGCPHSMGLATEDDILINFVFFPSAMATLIDKVIPGESVLSRFLLAALERGVGKSNYVSIHAGQEPRIIETLHEIMCEYIEEHRIASEEMTGFLVQELFTRLWRLSEEKPSLFAYGYAPDSKALQILNYIREHAVDCTRESVAAHFGYSGSRISNLLTEQFGKSFVALRNEIRLEMIDEKLRTTDLPVQTIAEQYGIPNQTHFYRMYKDYFGHLPRKES